VKRKTCAGRAPEFHEVTAQGPEHVRLSPHRYEKRQHCEELRLTHFIDNRQDALEHLRGHVKYLFLLDEQKQAAPAWATHLLSWPEVDARFPEHG
jgi:hypothetical protein